MAGRRGSRGGQTEAGAEDEVTADGRMQARWAIATGLVVVTASYILRVVLMPIPKGSRLDVAEIGLILMTGITACVILQPDLLLRVKNFKLLGLEVELERLREDQRRQKDELDDVRMVLTLLLQEHEIGHLRNLYRGETGGYRGCGPVRSELRKLRDLRLIQMKDGRNISELWDGREMDLRELVEVTSLGRKALERLDDHRGVERT